VDAPRKPSRLWPLLVAPLISTAVSAALLVLLVPQLHSELSELRGRLEARRSLRRDVARAEIAAMCRAIEAWAADHGGEYPPDLEALFTPDERGVTYLRSGPVVRAQR